MSPDTQEFERHTRKLKLLISVVAASVIFLSMSIAYVAIVNLKQETDIDSVVRVQSACFTDPDGDVCKVIQKNAVSLIQPQGACFIAAQAGYECRPARGAEAEQLRQQLRREASTLEDLIAAQNAHQP